jgi:hypothetical protein
MESYSPFFQTLHDEKSRIGHLGNGTHASILRAIVFHGPNLLPLTVGAPTDFAVIWDGDHDTRVIKAIESIYRAGLLGSILMVGERQGTLNVIASEQVQNSKLLKTLEDKVRSIAQKMDDDPWSSSVRVLDSPSHEIIDDRHDKVSLYLSNLKMLWQLGVKVSVRDRTKPLPELTDEQVLAIGKCVPGDSKKAEQTRILLMRTLARQLEAEKEGKAETCESYYAAVAPKLRSEFQDLTEEQILAVMKCVPGESENAHKCRVKLLLNLEKQIQAEKQGMPFSMTVWTPIEADISEQAAVAATERIETEDHRAESIPKIRLLES